MTIASSIEQERNAYEQIVQGSRTRSIFAEGWWLDAVTGTPEGWSANVLYGSDNAPLAAWPLAVRKTRYGLVGSGAPYTPWLGPQLLGVDSSPAKQAGIDVTMLEKLARNLATWAHVEAACMPELDYWTPLSWHGFTQTTRTTWRIHKDTVVDDLRSIMRKGARSTLSAAERDQLSVVDGAVSDLLLACSATFAHQQISSVPSADVLERVASAALKRGRGEIRLVHTKDGELASAGLFVWDDRFTYNLANGRIDREGVTGAPTLLLHDAALRALERGQSFDFEGSMLPGVEAFVRGFGGQPVPYSVVRRSTRSWSRSVARKRWLRSTLRRTRDQQF